VKERVFVDTNVLVYADDLDAGDKTQRARALLGELLREQSGVLSTQVLQEFFAVTTRKLKVDPAIARRKVELLATLDVVSIQVPHILHAIDLHRLHSVSFWDALILACAAAAGCARLWSEDLQHGAVIAGVKIENPFVA
jgi:predicted nucleic acid-binding protein